MDLAEARRRDRVPEGILDERFVERSTQRLSVTVPIGAQLDSRGQLRCVRSRVELDPHRERRTPVVVATRLDDALQLVALVEVRAHLRDPRLERMLLRPLEEDVPMASAAASICTLVSSGQMSA
jgi:hypothetical protein